MMMVMVGRPDILRFTLSCAGCHAQQRWCSWKRGELPKFKSILTWKNEMAANHTICEQSICFLGGEAKLRSNRSLDSEFATFFIAHYLPWYVSLPRSDRLLLCTSSKVWRNFAKNHKAFNCEKNLTAHLSVQYLKYPRCPRCLRCLSPIKYWTNLHAPKQILSFAS